MWLQKCQYLKNFCEVWLSTGIFTYDWKGQECFHASWTSASHITNSDNPEPQRSLLQKDCKISDAIRTCDVTAKPSLVPGSAPSSTTLWITQQDESDVEYLFVQDDKNETQRQKHSLHYFWCGHNLGKCNHIEMKWIT